jgi:hypothetical protein
MSQSASLPENAGLAYLGEAAWMPALLSAREVEKLTSATNACGRPNADVLRRRLAVVDDAPVESWQIDFPTHFTAQEAALYEQPFACLRKRAKGAWLNPHANPGLRRALARISRYLALPARAATPDWRWIEEDLLPDATLLVVARDDDFTHGVLQSTLFAAWHHAHRTRRMDPVQIVESFPFPWAPATALSALTAVQEEQRHAIARAVRGGGNTNQLNTVVLAAYGWPTDLADHELSDRLISLNRQRVG